MPCHAPAPTTQRQGQVPPLTPSTADPYLLDEHVEVLLDLDLELGPDLLELLLQSCMQRRTRLLPLPLCHCQLRWPAEAPRQTTSACLYHDTIDAALPQTHFVFDDRDLLVDGLQVLVELTIPSTGALLQRALVVGQVLVLPMDGPGPAPAQRGNIETRNRTPQQLAQSSPDLPFRVVHHVAQSTVDAHRPPSRRSNLQSSDLRIHGPRFVSLPPSLANAHAQRTATTSHHQGLLVRQRVSGCRLSTKAAHDPVPIVYLSNISY